MSLFDGKPLTIEEVRARLAQLGGDSGELSATIRKPSGRGVVRTMRHRPWSEFLGKGPDGKTCGDCEFLTGNKYFKCGKQTKTRGPGTDIRKKDQACRMFKEAE